MDQGIETFTEQEGRQAEEALKKQTSYLYRQSPLELVVENDILQVGDTGNR